VTPELYHKRLGHLSNQALSSLSNTVLGKNSDSHQKDLCDVHLRAKKLVCLLRLARIKLQNHLALFITRNGVLILPSPLVVQVIF